MRAEIGDDYIVVEFSQETERFYKYTYNQTGAAHVEAMKRLANQGQGLNSYINSNPAVKKGYESKW